MFKSIPNDPLGVIKFILGFGIIIYIVWLVSGGAERAQNPDDPFRKEPAPIDSGETYGLEGPTNS